MPSRARRYIGRWVTSRGIERNRPAVGNDHAQDHAEARGLSRAVSAEQSDDFLLSQNEADLIHYASAVVTLDQLGCFEKIHSEFISN